MSFRARSGLRARAAAWALAAAIGSASWPVGATDPGLLPALVGVGEAGGASGPARLGLSGFDPVTYWLDPEPRPGLPGLELARNGVVWRFASEANRAAFAGDPEAFLPRLGGFDAEALAGGRLVDADPLLFAVRGTGLYLFRTARARDAFLTDPTRAPRAESLWLSVQGDLIRG